MLFGVERNNAGLEVYRTTALHIILISPYQKKTKQGLLYFAFIDFYNVCLLLQIKRDRILFEIGTSFIFKERQMTRITSLNTTLKSLEISTGLREKHKRAAKRDF